MQSGDVLAERFEVREPIGEGGMGRVYLAWDRDLERNVAIKALLAQVRVDPRAMAEMKREVKLSQKLHHPGIVAVYDERGFRQVAGQILDAVEYAHHEGVVHRDLKPSNLMMTPQGRIKVMDLGIAATVRETYTRLTGHSSGLTVQYASPEHIRGEPPTPSMDIYSLGCTFYEMLSGHPPFFRGDVLHQQLSEKPPPLTDVRRPLSDALIRCLEKNPQRRFRTVNELAAALTREKTIRLQGPRREEEAKPGSTTRISTVSLRHLLKPQRFGWMLFVLGIAGGSVAAIWIAATVLSDTPQAIMNREEMPGPTLRTGDREVVARRPAAAGVPLESTAGERESKAGPSDRSEERVEGSSEVPTVPPAFEPVVTVENPTTERTRTAVSETMAKETLGSGEGRAERELAPASVTVEAGYSVEVVTRQLGTDATTANRPLSHGVKQRHTLLLQPGQYEISVMAPSVFLVRSEVIDLSSADDIRIPLPEVIEVRVAAAPGNCRVSIDGIPVDSTPFQARLVAGTHEFRFEWPELEESKTIVQAVTPNMNTVFASARDAG